MREFLEVSLAMLVGKLKTSIYGVS